MTALSDSYEAKRKDSEIQDYPVLASATIYKGGMIVDKGTGYASAGTDGSSYILLGVAVEDADNSSGDDGDKWVRVYKTGSYVYTKPDAAQSDVGTLVYVADDQTVGSSTTNSVEAGYVVEYLTSTTVRVRIDKVVQ